MNISIVIPNYNGEKLLAKNLPKVLEAAKFYKEGSVEIIVTDDASSDDSVIFLDEFKSKFKEKNIIFSYIKSGFEKNRGFSSNVNRGVSFCKGEIIILLNTDVSPRKDFISYLVLKFKDPLVFAVGCMDESLENDKIIPRGKGSIRWEKGFIFHKKRDDDKDITFWASGGSSAFKKDLWDKLGGLNNLYDPFYWEDIDISYRARKAGYKILFESKSVVIHEHSIGSIQENYKQKKITRIAYRNQFLFVWLNITDWNLLISHIFFMPFHVISAIKRRDLSFILGGILAFRKIKKVMQWRKEMKNVFLLTDSEVINSKN